MDSNLFLCLFTLTQVATVYNKAIATSDTDIIVNSVEILFIMDLDEWLFAGLEAWNENWTKHASDSEGTSSEGASSDVVAEKSGETVEMKEEIALQKEQVARQSEEIAMLRETVQKLQNSMAAFTSSESIPQCSANEILTVHSVESEETTCYEYNEGRQSKSEEGTDYRTSMQGDYNAQWP